MPLKITFASSDNALIQKFLERRNTVIAKLADAMTAQMVKLSQYTVTAKLSGQVLDRRTGVLADSITPAPATVTGGTVTGSVYTSTPYAAILSAGSSPHQIMARNTKSLRFMWNMAMSDKVMSKRAQMENPLEGLSEGIRFFRSVQHPGIPPKPFMSEALEESASSIVAGLQAAIFEALR